MICIRLRFLELKRIQEPVNVHFTPAGSNLLADQVAKTIEPSLPRKD